MSTPLPKQLPLRTIVADDHRLFRQGLISLMNTRPDLVTVVGEAEDGAGVVAMCEQRCPDLVLLDILMPQVDGLQAARRIQVDGLQAARRIRERCPETAIIMLTASETDEHLEQALRLGVAGYLPKSLDSEEPGFERALRPCAGHDPRRGGRDSRHGHPRDAQPRP